MDEAYDIDAMQPVDYVHIGDKIWTAIQMNQMIDRYNFLLATAKANKSNTWK